jgi:hypothetical protein
MFNNLPNHLRALLFAALVVGLNSCQLPVSYKGRTPQAPESDSKTSDSADSKNDGETCEKPPLTPILYLCSNSDPDISKSCTDNTTKLKSCGYDVKRIDDFEKVSEDPALKSSYPEGTLVIVDSHGDFKNGALHFPVTNGFAGSMVEASMVLGPVKEKIKSANIIMETCHSGLCFAEIGANFLSTCGPFQKSALVSNTLAGVTDILCSQNGIPDRNRFESCDANSDDQIDSKELTACLGASKLKEPAIETFSNQYERGANGSCDVDLPTSVATALDKAEAVCKKINEVTPGTYSKIERTFSPNNVQSLYCRNIYKPRDTIPAADLKYISKDGCDLEYQAKPTDYTPPVLAALDDGDDAELHEQCRQIALKHLKGPTAIPNGSDDDSGIRIFNEGAICRAVFAKYQRAGEPQNELKAEHIKHHPKDCIAKVVCSRKETIYSCRSDQSPIISGKFRLPKKCDKPRIPVPEQTPTATPTQTPPAEESNDPQPDVPDTNNNNDPNDGNVEDPYPSPSWSPSIEPDLPDDPTTSPSESDDASPSPSEPVDGGNEEEANESTETDPSTSPSGDGFDATQIKNAPFLAKQRAS